MSKQNDGYQRFGPEWEAEMMKMTKKDLIGFIRRQGRKLDYCIPIRQCKEDEVYLHQRQAEFSNNKGETLVELCMTPPTGLPCVFVRKGKNEGHRFIVSRQHLKQVIERLYAEDIPDFIKPENFR